ncbi:MAG: response regulator [Planctomycetota bacterium]
MQSKQTESPKAKKLVELLKKKPLPRQIVGSLVGCVHCGMCHEACHYALAFPDDPKMTPSYKADQLRKIFKRTRDWTGKVAPKWVGAKVPITDEDLEEIRDIAFGTCTNCRRCTYNCPMGVDTATLNRITRGLLTSVGVMPEGVRVVSKDQWEIGNQMGVLKEDFLDTIEWMSEELEEMLGHNKAAIPIDKKGARVVYIVNPREVKYDPRTIKNAALIFYAAKESWTMSSEGWDQTNFGLFSGDDQLGGVCGKRVYEKVAELGGEQLVISECGHGYRSTRHEAVNWSGAKIEFKMESAVFTMLRYIKEGKIKVDPTRNSTRVTYHDSCNLARSCGVYEEPRELLNLVVTDFQEMYPNRTENFCCTGGGGSMSMSEYAKRRLESGKIKANQIRATGAKIIATSCHNCIDGLSDLVKHYDLGCEVKLLVDLVANALVLDEPKIEEPVVETAPVEVGVGEPVARNGALRGRRILVVDDEEDARMYLTTVFQDAGAETMEATDGEQALEMIRKEHPDLVTLDLSMPGKNGVETFAEIRGADETADTLVCIVTGHPEFRKLIYDREFAPPEGYLNKPVAAADLVSNMRRILELVERKK